MRVTVSLSITIEDDKNVESSRDYSASLLGVADTDRQAAVTDLLGKLVELAVEPSRPRPKPRP